MAFDFWVWWAELVKQRQKPPPPVVVVPPKPAAGKALPMVLPVTL
jgi:hypothetical protein